MSPAARSEGVGVLLVGGACPRVAIACSGLGHIRRGNETWAQGVAEGLHAAGVSVELLGGGPLPGTQCRYTRLANLPRESFLTRSWVSWHRRYRAEQLSMAGNLLLRGAGRRFEILHVADPDLALQMHRRSPSALRVIYKDGLLLGPPFCRHFNYVQVLAPYYLDMARNQGVDTRNWFVIPHFVNHNRFHPISDKRAAREALGLRGAADALVVLAVGDFSPASNKRLAWIVNEFAALGPESSAHLLLAGQSSASEFTRFELHAKTILGERVHLFSNLQADQIARVYQAADVFAHAALAEPFGIVLLEAMASGLPIAGHQFPVTEWIIGTGGEAIDMTQQGRLSTLLRFWESDPALRRELGSRARMRAMSVFCEDKIIPRYQSMYSKVAALRLTQ